MAAHQTVPELLHVRKFPTLITPRHGVVTLFGYGIRVVVERGHLIVEDGVGPERRVARFARVGHGLRRLVIIGSEGFVSLAALRWLVVQDASFLMLERDGTVLATTSPVYSGDPKLRRAQSLAHRTGLALTIASELIRRKLKGQEAVVRSKLRNNNAADAIVSVIEMLPKAKSIESVRELEARGANTYWLAWPEVLVQFPTRDLPRVPEHWQKFGTRASPLTGSPRLAVNPPNAMLNYLYALLESESRMALAALGLDPGIGVLHVDSRSRDSFACDLMEAIRPDVDSYVLDWITRQPLRREWFFEQRDGNCRLMAKLAAQLSETSEMWRSLIAPVAEWVCRTIWSTQPKARRKKFPATRLTQIHRRISKGGAGSEPKTPVVTPANLCRSCGKPLEDSANRTCGSCAVAVSRENLLQAAKLGRVAAHSLEAQASRSATRRRHAAELAAWKPSNKPDWLTEDVYRQKIQPCLGTHTVLAIASALGVSEPYATDIRAGKRLPHPRHWQTLANVVGLVRI